MDVAVIIPNYNGENLLKKNLVSVIEALSDYCSKHKKQGEIIIVDDASEDNSIAYLQEMQTDLRKKSAITLRVLVNHKNSGFSTSINKGVAATQAVVVVLLNTDVSPEKDFMNPLLRHFKDDKVFAVGCMDKSIEKEGSVFRGRGVGEWKKGFLVHKRGEVDKTDTLWASGGSSAYSKKIWDIMGGLYEIYDPFYWEDIDISYRALKAGYSIYFEKKSIVIHSHEEGAIKTKYSHNDILTIAYRNQLLFTWINLSDFAIFFQHLLWLPYFMISSALKGSPVFLKGFLQALVLFPQVIRYRSRTQKIVVKKDKDIVVS